jgi:hypothetical protein
MAALVSISPPVSRAVRSRRIVERRVRSQRWRVRSSLRLDASQWRVTRSVTLDEQVLAG